MPLLRLYTKIPNEMIGLRLDKALAQLFPDYSRARLQQWIHAGYVQVNATALRGKEKVQGGENVYIEAIVEDEVSWQAQALPLTLLYADEDILVVHKPAGIVVHPGAGNSDHTLVNALLHHAPELAQLPRAGIIHRLDKDTSGILVVARSLAAHSHLIDQQQRRQFKREYHAVVNRIVIAGGTVDAPLGRHPYQRTQMAVVANGKPAITHYRVLQRYRAHTHLQIRLETGRTHQIRVHLAHIGHPLVGDPVYGGRLLIPPHSDPHLIEVLKTFPRQALHASLLGFIHPQHKEFMQWQLPLPEDMEMLLAALATDQQTVNQ